MFSYDERIKAVKLLIQYDLSYSTVIRELGYPSKQSLRNWYNEYFRNGDLHQDYVRESIFSEEEKQRAVNYYLEHGRSVSRTVKKLGYPSRPVLDKWILDIAPEKKKHCRSGGSTVKYSREQKEQAVISLCSRDKPAKEVATEHGTTRESLYNWKSQLLKGERIYSMNKNKSDKLKGNLSIDVDVSELRAVKDDLLSQVDELQKEVYRLKIERDIYEKAAEIIKKDQGINLKTLTNREKAIIINALREVYPLKELLEMMCMAKSSYCYQVKTINFDKYTDLRMKVKKIFKESARRYGYRRIHSVLKTLGTTVSEKVIRRIMREENLVVPI